MLPVDKMSQSGQQVTWWTACHTEMNCHRTLNKPHNPMDQITTCSTHPNPLFPTMSRKILWIDGSIVMEMSQIDKVS